MTTSKILLFFNVFFLFVAISLRPIGFDSDSIGYLNWIKYDLYHEMAEPFFVLLVDLSKYFELINLHSLRFIIFIFAALNLFYLYLIILQAKTSYNLILLLLFFTIFPIFLFTQIRVSLALTIFFYTLILLYKSRLYSALFNLIFSLLIHNLIYLLLPLLLIPYINLTRKKILTYSLISIPAIILMTNYFQTFSDFLFSLDILPSLLESKYHSYLNYTYNAVSLFNLHFVYLLFVYLLSFYYYPFFDEFGKYVFSLLTFIILLYFLFSPISTISARVMFFGYLPAIFLLSSISHILKFRDSSLLYIFISLNVFLSFILFLNTLFRNSLLNFEVVF